MERFLCDRLSEVPLQIVDKIRIQMDAFLEEGSHEASIAVVRALVVSVPYTTDKLRNYILNMSSCAYLFFFALKFQEW